MPACDNREAKKERLSAVKDRSTMPVLDAKKVMTLVSDSGVTRYRIKAETWQIYDQTQPPYWEFPDGIYLEKFDLNLHIDASLESDYAHYDNEAQIWELRGNVHAMNLKGETFDTQCLFWNQITARIYSDSAITITKKTSIIQGVGFDSNQQMSEYSIRKPTGSFPIEEKE